MKTTSVFSLQVGLLGSHFIYRQCDGEKQLATGLFMGNPAHELLYSWNARHQMTGRIAKGRLLVGTAIASNEP